MSMVSRHLVSKARPVSARWTTSPWQCPRGFAHDPLSGVAPKLAGYSRTAYCRPEDDALMNDLATETTVMPRSSDLEEYRTELTGYCYRMLGSVFEAEDAVQETLVRAWRGSSQFQGRSSLRSWLYRIATNVSIDMLNGRKRRALPMDMGPASAPVAEAIGAPAAEGSWVEPVPDGRVISAGSDPAEVAVSRESVRLAFVAALQHLPARQRAVLILREVLRWEASEVADLLDTSVAAVNSALQRARATMASRGLDDDPSDPVGETERVLLDRYVDAFQRYDITSLVSLLHEDATQSMPPYPMWLRGRDDIGRWLLGPGSGCEGSVLVPVEVNGRAGFAQYRASGNGEGHQPFSLQIVDVSDGRISRFTHYVEPRLFPLFGLAAELP